MRVSMKWVDGSNGVGGLWVDSSNGQNGRQWVVGRLWA